MLLGPLASPSVGQVVSDRDVICPPDQLDRFTDDDGSVHERSINCAATYGLVSGTGPATFGPNLPLSRGQAATILIGYVEQSLGEVLPQVPDAARPVFTDTAGNVHENSIERAEDNGLLTGFADGTFRPGQPVTRAQFATIAVQATEAILDEELGGRRHRGLSTTTTARARGQHREGVRQRLLNGAAPGVFNPRKRP
jgi:hypothetical protein